MKKKIPHLIYRPVRDFLEMASVIAGAKLFIGNQSFPFSLAEALKANRLLEVYFECPNVTVYGENGFDFSFQPQFEKLIRMRYENCNG
jgi:ADP-heptose:LPS heptosyltransferase